MQLKRFWTLAVLISLNLTLLGGRHGGNTADSARATAERVVALEGLNLPGPSNGGSIEDLAIAPDSSAFAIKFAAVEAPGVIGLYLGLRQLPGGEKAGEVRLAKSQGSPNGFWTPQLEFSPDGANIIVADWSTIYVVDAQTLGLVTSIQVPNRSENPRRPSFVRLFSISADSSTLVVLSGGGPYAPGIDLVQVFHLKTGEEIGRWSEEDKLKSISVSTSGELLLANLIAPEGPDDILLMQAASGKIIQRLRSGYGYQQGASSLSTVMFLGNERFMAVPDHSVDQNDKYPDRIRIIDLSSRTNVQELTYERFGPTGVMGVSEDEKTIMALNYPVRHAKSAQLLFYHVDKSAPYCVLDPVPVKEADGKNSPKLRFGADPSFFGVFTPNRLGIYKLSNCDAPGGVLPKSD